MIRSMIRETLRRESARYAQLAFMAAVTALLLALVAEQTGRGPAGLPATVVYAFAAGFGLEFVGSAWRGERRNRGAGSELRR